MGLETKRFLIVSHLILHINYFALNVSFLLRLFFLTVLTQCSFVTCGLKLVKCAWEKKYVHNINLPNNSARSVMFDSLRCAGVCSYEGRGGLCSVRLSEPLLKLRPRKDLVQVGSTFNIKIESKHPHLIP